jgi:hypothetical protein
VIASACEGAAFEFFVEISEIFMEINNLRRSRNPEINGLRKAQRPGLAALGRRAKA